MTKFVHIVYVHPVENGEPNLHKVVQEHEFRLEASAKSWADRVNKVEAMDGQPEFKAVYYGCVNDATGELV
jgi:hypothetical protein